MYMKLGFLDSALKVFDEMSERNVNLFNVVVSGFCLNGYLERGFGVFGRFGEFGVRPDSVTVSSLLSGCGGDVRVGGQVHCWGVKIGVESDIYVATSLVTMYSKCKDSVGGSKVFESMSYRNVECYNAFYTGLLQNGICGRVLEVFKETFCWSSLIPNVITFVSVLSACSELKSLKFGRGVHGLLVKDGLVLNALVGTSLLDMYSKCGYWHWAYDVFKQLHAVRSLITWNSMISGMMLNGEHENAIDLFMMLESDGLKPDSATWNTMINGLSQVGKNDEAILFFRKMQSVEEHPSMKCVTSLLSACASIPALMTGKEIHGHVIRTSIDQDEFVATALINMYMKCGRSLLALSVFDQYEIKPRDPVIWNAMISGYGRNGETEAAFNMFEWMQRENVKPNSSTFNSVLSICSHAGKVEKGLDLFRLMKCYKLVPTSENYACVIDILGRSGRIDEARELLLETGEASSSVLASLLGACKFHSDVKHGEEIARLLADLDPESSTPFVILSNIYAGEGRWKDVEELRYEMDRKRLKKGSGFSLRLMRWIKALIPWIKWLKPLLLLISKEGRQEYSRPVLAVEVDGGMGEKMKISEMGLLPKPTRNKFLARNIITAKDALSLTEFELMELLDADLADVTLAVALISEIVSPPYQTVQSLLEQRLKNGCLTSHLPTQLKGLDAALFGGIPFGALTELVGPSGIGKTQFCLKLSLLAALPSGDGGLDGHVIYIDVESKFSSKRLIEIFMNSFPATFCLGGKAKEMAGRITVLRPGTLAELTESLQKFKASPLKDKVKLLIVDSMAALVSGEYEQGAPKKHPLGWHISFIKSLAEDLRIPIVMTNQVRARSANQITQYSFQESRTGSVEDCRQSDSHLVAALGIHWAHAVTIRLVLESRSGQRFIKVAKSPMSPPLSFPFEVTSMGIVLLNDDGVEMAGPQINAIDHQGHSDIIYHGDQR
uniref:Pentatricopeptide repeat-containing protein At2g02750 n=1 Tax=Tanacetum cinerariifolium TaxID=118510 RepID=A0A699GM15_TANCI|nr:pentatricopeptide repeat-containing protein At2g02750 [Tanacetum cinerariifolium]